MGASFGVGAVVSSLVNPAKEISSKFIGRMLGSALQGATSFTVPVVIRAVVKEIGQELLLDPWIESTVSGLARRAGHDAMTQMILSSIAESGREALTGPLTNLINPQKSQQPSFTSILESKYFSKGLKPTGKEVLDAFNEYQTEIRDQQEEQRGDLRLLGGASRALSFVYLAMGFTASQFLGPVGALFYSTLAVYCFSEEISLKGVFREVFKPVIKKISDSKVGNYYRNNKKKVLSLVGIGALSIGLKALQILLPPLAIFVDFALGFGGPITIGMASQWGQIDLAISVRDLIQRPRKQAIILRKNQIMSNFLKKSVQSVTLDRDIVKVALHTNIASMDFAAVKPFKSRLTIFTKTSQELMQIYRKKGTQFVDERQVFGVIYGIIDWDVGEIVKVGRTESPLAKRRGEYYSKAKNLKKKTTDPVTQRIVDLLNKGGQTLAKSTLQWIPIEIVLRTGSSQQKWDFDKKLIETLEQWWQNKLGTKINGLDRTSGGAGRHSIVDPIGSGTADVLVPDVILNWRVLRTLISKGCTYPQMIDILANRYMLTVTMKDIIDNIEYHWPFLIEQALQKAPSILKDAKYYFIAPIIKSYVESGITSSNQIQGLFRSTENPQGISSKTIIRAVKKEYQVSSWAWFLKLCGAPLSFKSLQRLTPREYRAIGGKSKENYDKFIISQYLIEGRNEEYIDNQLPDLTHSTIQRRIKRWWGSYYEARKQLVGPILALCFKKGWSSAQILANVPFFQNAMTGCGSSRRVFHFSDQWFGITPSAAKNFLVTHNLHWFLTNYL